MFSSPTRLTKERPWGKGKRAAERLAREATKVSFIWEMGIEVSTEEHSAEEVLSSPVPDLTCLPCIKMLECIKTGGLRQLSAIGASSPVSNHLEENVMRYPL